MHEQSAYLCAFYDQFSDFIKNNSGNIEKFINEWNEIYIQRPFNVMK